MASDESYSTFLDRANQDTGASNQQSTQSKAAATTKAVDTEEDIPAPLKKIEAFYTSEADEPFEPVSLRWGGGGMPSEDDFANLIGHKGKGGVSRISVKEFDPRREYTEVVDAVEKVGQGGEDGVRVFKVEVGGTRVVYYVVGFEGEGKEGRVVGMRVVAVES